MLHFVPYSPDVGELEPGVLGVGVVGVPLLAVDALPRLGAVQVDEDSAKLGQILGGASVVTAFKVPTSRVGGDTFEMYLRYRYRYARGCIFCIFQILRYRYH